MRSLCSILFIFLFFGQLPAQVIFKPSSSKQLQLNVYTLQFDSSNLSNPSNPSNLSNPSNPLLKSGIIQNTYFESHVGGNNEPLQAVLLQFNTAQNLLDSQFNVVPVGIAKWGQVSHLFRLKSIDVPFVVCILPSDSNQFEHFAKNYLGNQDFEWVEVPHKKESSLNVFEKTSIDEYIIPLPCNHDPIYLEYTNDSMLSLSIDDQLFENVNVDSCFINVGIFLNHLNAFHGAYCERSANVFFSHRNVDMKRATALFERFSELNVQLKLIFSTSE